MNYAALYQKEYEVLNQRLDLLFEALLYCSRIQDTGRGYIFTVNERILINQERGALMSQQTMLLYNDDSQLRHFSVPTSIEQKILLLKSKL